MDPTYYLLLLFIPVPVVLLCAIIKVIYSGKKQSEFIFDHLQSNETPSKPTDPVNQEPGQPSAS
jgi:hypothetical protein